MAWRALYRAVFCGETGKGIFSQLQAYGGSVQIRARWDDAAVSYKMPYVAGLLSASLHHHACARGRKCCRLQRSSLFYALFPKLWGTVTVWVQNFCQSWVLKLVIMTWIIILVWHLKSVSSNQRYRYFIWEQICRCSCIYCGDVCNDNRFRAVCGVSFLCRWQIKLFIAGSIWKLVITICECLILYILTICAE